MKRCLPIPPVGFTLIELLVVIAIIGLLLTILVPVVRTARLQAEVSRTRVRVTELGGACDLYHKDTGYYPGQDDPGRLAGDSGPYTGSQYLAEVLLVHGGAQFDSSDFLDKGPDGKLSTGGTISDRTSKGMAILYFPARRNLTGLLQFKRGDNSKYLPSIIDDNAFKAYIRNPALDDDEDVEDTDEPFADGKFIIVAPNYKGEYFTGGPTYPGL